MEAEHNKKKKKNVFLLSLLPLIVGIVVRFPKKQKGNFAYCGLSHKF